MHPIEHDLGCTVPTCRHIAGHLVIALARETKVQNLKQRVKIMLVKMHKKETFSSQSSFTAILDGLRSLWMTPAEWMY